MEQRDVPYPDGPQREDAETLPGSHEKPSQGPSTPDPAHGEVLATAEILHVYPRGFALGASIMALMMAIFLVALDANVLGEYKFEQLHYDPVDW